MDMQILLVDDDRDSRAAVRWFLRDQGHTVVECGSGEEALQQFTAGDFPMVLSDIRMPGMSGVELLMALKKFSASWRTDVVLFTGYADVESAVAALRAGAYDYLFKPVDAQELAVVVDRIAEHQALLRENKEFKEKFNDAVAAATAETRRELARMERLAVETAVGKVGAFSTTTQAVLDLAVKFHHDRAIPVLIQGETGTGKEIVAKTIHFGDCRNADAAGPFVDINCAAIAPPLFESELFGYEAGAFTGGASKGQKGKLDLAAGGTLFLDEVGEIPLELQGKLLRVLQEKEYYRVGGLKRIRTDARIVCATNASLEERVTSGAFRRDLYYRLKVGEVFLSPLRNRREEILPLATMFLQDFARQKGKKFREISPEAGRLLDQYDWPGNIRELKNTIEFAVFMYDELKLKPSHLTLLDDCVISADTPPAAPDKQVVLPLPAGGYLLKQYTQDVVRIVLAAHNGNQTATARYLGISLRALSYRLEQAKDPNAARSSGKKK